MDRMCVKTDCLVHGLMDTRQSISMTMPDESLSAAKQPSFSRYSISKQAKQANLAPIILNPGAAMMWHAQAPQAVAGTVELSPPDKLAGTVRIRCSTWYCAEAAKQGGRSTDGPAKA